MTIIQGLPPVADSHSRILILGTFPGPESLRRQEYYADWRNKFWEVMLAAFGINPAASYENRKRQLLRHRLALWDVIRSCRREGALDTGIRDPSPNDLSAFLESQRRIRHIVFNGDEARRYAKRLKVSLMDVPVLTCTSTSGTNTHYTVQKKGGIWAALKAL